MTAADMTENDPITMLLSKRARHSKVCTEPNSKRHHADTQCDIVVDDCLELCALLLQRAGATVPTKAEHPTLHELLSREYSPRVAELLSNITVALNKNASLPFDSDSSNFSSDDDVNDAVVPTISTQDPAVIKRDPEQDDAQVPADFSAPRSKSNDWTGAKPRQNINLTAYKNETEIAISRIFDLGKVTAVADSSIPADAPYAGPSVVTMTGFGELGRFGNQVIQYMFLKSYATIHGVKEIQVPGWVGAGLFGITDRPVQRAFPAIVEFRGTKANSTFTTDLIDYVKNSNYGRNVSELTPDALRAEQPEGAVNVDIWGWFQWHTSYYAPFKDIILDTFTPVGELRAHCGRIFDEQVRFRNGQKHTVVGLHLRLGDYESIATSSFGYPVPTSWYLEWLANIWQALENPILFVASDNVNAVLKDFADYSPVTADSIGMKVPASMKGLKAGFFPDWFGLTQCDVLAISNSTFSFSACMLNRIDGARFFRAHFKERMVLFNPWDAEPIIHRDENKAGIAKTLETLQMVYNTQGSRGLARNLLYALPYHGIRAAIMKAVLWRRANLKATQL